MTRIPELVGLNETEEVPLDIMFIFIVPRSLLGPNLEKEDVQYLLNVHGKKVIYDKDENGWLNFKEEDSVDQLSFQNPIANDM